jgi:hypothetical protein
MRHVAHRVVVDSLGQSEIEHLDTAAGRSLDIRRLQIPMDDALGMCGLKRAGGLACDCQCFRQRQRPWTEAIGQRVALDQLEDECDDIFTFLERVNARDVRMIQRRQDLRLAPEASDTGAVVSQRRREHLDGDVPTKLDVARAVHVAHAAGADARGDFVLAQPPPDERRGGWLKAGRIGMEGGLLEKVVGKGLVEQRLDVVFERVVAGTRIVEELSPAFRGQRQRFVKQSFDVQPVLWRHRTQLERDLMVAYRPSRERLRARRISR